MKYATVKAKTYPEAISRLKDQYGDDAYAIAHKNVKEGGLFNSRFLAKNMVEVTVGIPAPKGEKNSGKGRNLDIMAGKVEKENMNMLLQTVAARRMSSYKAFEGKASDESKASVVLGQSAGRPYVQNESPADPIAKLEKSIAELKEAFSVFSAKQGEYAEKKYEVPAALGKCARILKRNDFDEEERESMLRTLRSSISNEDMQDEHKIEKSLKELLKSRIITSGPIKTGARKKIVMFIGPTGVGKTTTLAKIGAKYALNEGRRVIFITLDNYRIAATEQLKKYAEIIELPIFAINEQKEFRSVVERENADIVLVDTAGRNYRNQMKISEIKSFADVIDYELEKVLCVSANTRKSEVDELFSVFEAINFDSVIITKVDETSNVGNIVDVADKYNKPISYFTNGQEVPTDIVVADSDNLVELMIGNINN